MTRLATGLALLLAGAAAAGPTAGPAAAPPTTPGASAGAARDHRPVELVCDRMEVLHRQRLARCTGRVTLKRGEMRLTCDRLEATYGADGEVSAAVCRGNVHFYLPPRVPAEGADDTPLEAREAGGEQADYDAERDVLVLKGQPWMRQGDSVVRGRGIVYDLAEERMVIEQARGRLRMDRVPGVEPAP